MVDVRGSGASHRIGTLGRVNQLLRQTPLNEMRESRWTVDDQVKYDIPAILDFVQNETGADRVNWVGHSLGGMIMLGYLETTDRPERVANFVDMGGVTTVVARRSRGRRCSRRTAACASCSRSSAPAGSPGR